MMKIIPGKKMLWVCATTVGLLCISCQTAPDDDMGSLQGEAPMLVNKDQNAMYGFSWVINKQVAGMPRPGGARPLEQDLAYLNEQGLDVLVSLTETPINPQALQQHGIAGMHIPVQDFHAPTQEQLDQYVGSVQGWLAEGKQVGTHCAGGKGRTGTFLAALFVARGMGAEEAIAEIRKLRPGSIETKEQEEAVKEFAARQKK